MNKMVEKNQFLENENPIQILSNSGFKVIGECESLTAQARAMIKQCQSDRQKQKKLPPRLWESIEKANQELEILIGYEPTEVLLATHAWLSLHYVRPIAEGSKKSVLAVDWLLSVTPNGEYAFSDMDLSLVKPAKTVNLRQALQKGLLGSFDYHPLDTVNALQFCSKMYTIMFSGAEPLASPERLELYFLANLGWRSQNSPFLEGFLRNFNRIYSAVFKHKTGTIKLIIATLEYWFKAPAFQRERLDRLFIGWQKTIHLDKEFFAKYSHQRSLEIATQTVCNSSDVKGYQQIAKLIDKEVGFTYSDEQARRNIYRKIDQSYIGTTPAVKTGSITRCFTLTEEERANLTIISELTNQDKTKTLGLCISFALKESKKSKKSLRKTNQFLLNRSDCPKTSVRLHPAAIQQLTELTKKLNDLKLTSNKVNRSSAVGWAIMLYSENGV